LLRIAEIAQHGGRGAYSGAAGLVLVSGSVLVKRRIEVTFQVTRGGEPLIAGFALIRLDAFRII